MTFQNLIVLVSIGDMRKDQICLQTSNYEFPHLPRVYGGAQYEQTIIYWDFWTNFILSLFRGNDFGSIV